MILGLNSDIRYKGKTFHIQTEDSGTSNPMLITHVFIGGTIIHTVKQRYEDALGRDDLEKHVRQLMRDQHRTAYKSLLDGQFDEAAKRTRTKSTSHIPLARDTKKKKKDALKKVPSSPPEYTEELDETVDMRAVPPPPPAEALSTDDEIAMLGSMEVVLIEEEGGGGDKELSPEGSEKRVEYATDLLSNRPLDLIIVDYLLEELE